MNEELKKLLGDDLAAEVAEKLGEKELFMHDKTQKVMVDDGSLIPRYRLDEVTEKHKALETQVAQYDKDMKALKKAAEGNTDLTAKIEELQTAMKNQKADADASAQKLAKSFAVKEALIRKPETYSRSSLMSRRSSWQPMENPKASTRC
jgi:uncharacterized phage infection (PIP) family protein YhgE